MSKKYISDKFVVEGGTSSDYLMGDGTLSSGNAGNETIGTDTDLTTSGATVVDDINLTDGVVTAHSTRTLTLANLGYTGDTDANNSTPRTDEEIRDVAAAQWTDGANTTVVYDDATNTIKINAPAGGVVDGSGVQNYLVKWTDSDTLTDSIMHEVNNRVGINVIQTNATFAVSKTGDETLLFEPNVSNSGRNSISNFDFSDNSYVGINYDGLDHKFSTSGVVKFTINSTTIETPISIEAESFIKTNGLSTQYLMADGSTTTSSGGSSPWTTDTNGITYTAGNVGIGMASGATLDLAVNGDVRFYDELRVDGATQIGGDLEVSGTTSLSDELSMDGNNILTEGGDIEDKNSSTGTAGQYLTAAIGGGVEWITPTTGGGSVTIDATAGEILAATGSTISAKDAAADKIVFWDDSASQLDYLTIGSGLSLSGTTLTATGGGGGGSQNLFETIAVSGQSSIVAGSTTDTLNFAAGTGISLTTNALTDTLTITATGGGGGGSVDGSGTTKYIPKWTASDTLGNSSLIEDSAGEISIVDTDGGATAGPILNLDRQSSSAATNDLIGVINFKGKASSTEVIYGKIQQEIKGTGGGAGIDGAMVFSNVNNGTLQEHLEFRSGTSYMLGSWTHNSTYTNSDQVNITGVLKMDGSAGTNDMALFSKGASTTPVWKYAVESNTTDAGANTIRMENMVRMTQSNYDALSTYQSNCLYVIVG